MLMRKLKRGIEDGIQSVEVPKEVIDMFNKDLPEGLRYVSIGEHRLRIDAQINGIATIIEEDNIAWFQNYKRYFREETQAEDILRIAQLTQTPLRIRMPETIQCDGKEIKRSMLIRDITKGEATHETQTFLMPTEPIKRKVCFSVQGEPSLGKELELQLQKCEDVEKLTYSTPVDTDPLKFSFTVCSEYYTGSDKSKVSLSFNVDSKEAKNVRDALVAFKIYKAFLEGKLFLNDALLTPQESNIPVSIADQIDSNIKYLSMLLELENVLQVEFDIRSGIEKEDIEIIIKMYLSLIKGTSYKLNNKLEKLNLSESIDLEGQDIKGDTTTAWLSVGNVEVNLLGQTFNLYQAICYFGVKVKNIIRNDEEDRCEILFDQTSDRAFTAAKIYLKESDMNAAIDNNTIPSEFEKSVDLKDVEL